MEKVERWSLECSLGVLRVETARVLAVLLKQRLATLRRLPPCN